MTAIASHLSAAELEARYETAADPIAKSHFHAVWLLSLDYTAEEVAELLSFSVRWVRLLVKRYNEHGPDSLGDRRLSNGAAPAILTIGRRLEPFLQGRPLDWTQGRALARQIPRPQVRARSARLGCARCHRIFHPETEAAPSQSGGRRGSRRAKKNCKTLPLKRNASIGMR